MNLDRHMNAHKELFVNLVRGDGDSVEKHKEFYDEYLAVMDLAAEYYLQTVDQVFVKHQLPKGEMLHRGHLIDLTAIKHTALDDDRGREGRYHRPWPVRGGNPSLPEFAALKKLHYTQPGVGHYGIFNGSAYRHEIVPRIVAFMSNHDVRGGNLKYVMHRLSGEKGVEAFAAGVPSTPAIMPVASSCWLRSPPFPRSR